MAVGTLVLTVLLYIGVPKGFFPVQDTGVIQGVAEAPQDTSFEAMGGLVGRLFREFSVVLTTAVLVSMSGVAERKLADVEG